MIYIASPFTSDNVFLEAERHDAVRLYTAGCIERGEVAYSPIVHGRFDLSRERDRWRVQHVARPLSRHARQGRRTTGAETGRV